MSIFEPPQIIPVRFLNPWWAWVLAGGLALGSFIGLKLAKFILIKSLTRMAQRIDSLLDRYLIEVLSRQTRTTFLIIFSLYLGTLALNFPDRWRIAATDVVLIALFIMMAQWANEAIRFWFTRRFDARVHEDPEGSSTLVAMSFLARVILWSVLLLVVLNNLGVNITTLVTGLGIGGVAIALAGQTILADFFSSFAITLDKPFRVGDFIIVGDFKGTVERIGLKTTSVRSLDGEQIVFSNSDLLKSRIRNYKRMTERRVLFHIGVTYQTPHERLEDIKRIIREVIEAVDRTRVDRVHFLKYGDFALVFEVVYYVLDRDYKLYMDIQDQINSGIYRRFAEIGVEFAYPTRTVFQIRVPTPADDSGPERPPS
jgi:small-conductance mechanosensitive channel